MVTGEVCHDGEEHGHQHQETAISAGAGGKRSALLMPIGLRIAVESPNGYSDTRNKRSSGESRLMVPSSPIREGHFGSPD